MPNMYSPVPYAALLHPRYCEPKALVHPDKGFYIGQDMVSGEAVFKPLEEIEKDGDPIPCFSDEFGAHEATKIKPDDWEKLHFHVVYSKDCDPQADKEQSWREARPAAIAKGFEVCDKVATELPILNGALKQYRRSAYKRKLQRLETKPVKMPQARPAHYVKRHALNMPNF